MIEKSRIYEMLDRYYDEYIKYLEYMLFDKDKSIQNNIDEVKIKIDLLKEILNEGKSNN